MKIKMLLVILFVIYVKSYAQFGAQETITTNAYSAKSVFATDIDGDGDIDVLSASVIEIAWYENLDGQGNFGVQQIISTEANSAQSVFAADIDGDGDMDVLSASYVSDKIAWYENTDGLGNFGTQQIISTEAFSSRSIYATDLDGDGDIDVLSASYIDDKIAWYENTDGQGSFGTQQIITTDANGAYFVYVGDIDGDGDMDALSASRDDNKIAWYENIDGQGSFGTQQIITTDAQDAYSVYTSDLDGDGDLDVLSASVGDNKIAWYENTDGLGNFGTQQIITTNTLSAISIFTNDFDNDGDIDVLSASYGDNKIAWYENIDGQGGFGTQQIISLNANGVWSVFSSDLDNDGDMDVLSASSLDNKIAWYENLTPLGLHETSFNDFYVYPNPATKYLNVNSKTSISQIDMYNNLGQLVLTNLNQNTIDLSNLSKGFYLIKIKDNYGNSGYRKILKE